MAASQVDLIATTSDNPGGFPRSHSLVASGSSTTSYASTDPNPVQVNCQGAGGLSVTLVTSDVTGGGGVAVAIAAWDPSTSSWRNLVSGSGVTGSTTIVYQVNPHIAASAGLIAQQPLPARVRITFTGSGTRTTLNYSSYCTLQPG